MCVLDNFFNERDHQVSANSCDVNVLDGIKEFPKIPTTVTGQMAARDRINLKCVLDFRAMRYTV